MSTDVQLVRTVRGLSPATAYDADQLALYPVGRELRATLRQSRSVRQHRLFFSLVAHVAQAVGRSTEDLLDIIKLETGHCRVIERKGGRIRVPDSIAFHRMDQAQFRAFFDAALAVIIEETGMRQPDLLAELSRLYPDLMEIAA